MRQITNLSLITQPAVFPCSNMDIMGGELKGAMKQVALSDHAEVVETCGRVDVAVKHDQEDTTFRRIYQNTPMYRRESSVELLFDEPQ